MPDLVEAAVELGNAYTLGMIAAPLALTGLAYKAFEQTKPEKAPALRPVAWAVAAAALFSSIVLVPPYFTARSRCETLLSPAQPVSVETPAVLIDKMHCRRLLNPLG
jgi:hypothetical protein